MDEPEDEQLRRYERWIKALQYLHNRSFAYAGAFMGMTKLDVQRRAMLFTVAGAKDDAGLAQFVAKFPMAPEGAIADLVRALRVKVVELRLLEGK